MKILNKGCTVSVDLKAFPSKFKKQGVEPGLKKARKASQFSKR